MFRVPVPKVDMDAFREAVANALLHRDYHQLGAVHVRLENEALVVSNPGGLVDGVTLANLLTTEPRPRYLGLVDAMKRIGVVERSGRGVDTIYRGMLRFGRALPDYSRTDAHSVVLVLPTGAADLEFLKLVVEEENKQRGKLPVDSLIALSTLREMKRVTANELASRIQRDGASAKRTLEALIERGLAERHGSGRNTSYTLSVLLYQAAGDKVAYTRQAGFTALQHQQLVCNYAQQHGRVKRADVMELCHLSEDQATRFLKKLTDSGLLQRHGQKRGSFYTLIEQTSA
jgi:ATP-dependent DNA helicase RecG